MKASNDAAVNGTNTTNKTPPQTAQRDTGAVRKERAPLFPTNAPTFYIGQGNNPELVTDILKRLGWEQIFETNDESYRLRWVQTTRGVNWNQFREGEQMVNHIPNCGIFTNKLNLLCSLQAYEKSQVQMKHAHFIPLEDYLPVTYKLDDRVDKETFFATAKENELWICKPVSMNQGKGIYLVRSPMALKQKLEFTVDGQKRLTISKPLGRIIQKYINNPLLVNKRKFDIRNYMVIANTKPLLCLFHHGYLRLSMNDFNNDDTNLITHLTNQFFQKKDPQYKIIKEDTTWTMDQFNEYVNKEVAPVKGLPADWVRNELTKKMQNIMLQVIHSIRFKLQRKTGYFGIYGYDFMIDDNMKVWLIEVNVNPSISTNTDVLNQAIPPVIEECLRVSIECFEKSRARRPLLPLASLKSAQVLFCESHTPQPMPRGIERTSTMIRRSPSSPAVVPKSSATLTRNVNTTSETVAPLVRSNTRASFSVTNNASTSSTTKVVSKSLNEKIIEERLKAQVAANKTRRLQASLSTLQLKPSTVEVYFRTDTDRPRESSFALRKSTTTPTTMASIAVLAAAKSRQNTTTGTSTSIEST